MEATRSGRLASGALAVRRRADELRGSFWLIPVLCVVASVGAAIGFIALDRSFNSYDGVPWIYQGGPTNASATLTTIASSTITFTGLVFTITMVALQLTSSQFSPRAMRNFLRDRRAQIALGVFVATFSYAFSALAAVRLSVADDPGFVPRLTVSGSFALVGLSIVVFVRLIHHTAQSLRAVTIIERIALETRAAIGRVYPCDVELPGRPELGAVAGDVEADRAGVLTDVDLDRLGLTADGAGVVAEVLHPVGTYLCEGVPVVRLHCRSNDRRVTADSAALGAAVCQCLHLAPERTMQQDVAFGIRQLVDIAERALSPGVNDPTTAVEAIDRIHDLLRRLVGRSLPERRLVTVEGRPAAWVPMLTAGELVALGLDELRHWGAGSPRVQHRLGAVLADLLVVAHETAQPSLREQQRLLTARLDELPVSERVRASVGGNGERDGR